jgi:hypothetical protein
MGCFAMNLGQVMETHLAGRPSWLLQIKRNKNSKEEDPLLSPGCDISQEQQFELARK